MEKTLVETIKEKMLNLQNARTKELEEIQTKLAEARDAKAAADVALKGATERMDLEAYEKAREASGKARRAIEMYSGRYEQIRAKEFVTEADSDKVINDLLAYEDQLAESFKDVAGKPLSELMELVKVYMDEVAATENVLTSWQQDIHPNYSTRGRASYVDPVTGQRSDKSPTPVPVHSMPFLGCDEAIYLKQYLDQFMEE